MTLVRFKQRWLKHFDEHVLDQRREIYVVSADFSWTYIKTHEDDFCGPYFYSKKNGDEHDRNHWTI